MRMAFAGIQKDKLYLRPLSWDPLVWTLTITDYSPPKLFHMLKPGVRDNGGRPASLAVSERGIGPGKSWLAEADDSHAPIIALLNCGVLRLSVLTSRISTLLPSRSLGVTILLVSLRNSLGRGSRCQSCSSTFHLSWSLILELTLSGS